MIAPPHAPTPAMLNFPVDVQVKNQTGHTLNIEFYFLFDARNRPTLQVVISDEKPAVIKVEPYSIPDPSHPENQ